MKPIELGKFSEFAGYSEMIRLFHKYQNEDCVVAYRKCFMGNVILIQGKKEMFGFLILNKVVNRWGRVPELQRKSLREIKIIFNEVDDKNQVVIINEDGFKLFERKVLFDGITANE